MFKKIRQYKLLLFEICETLETLCFCSAHLWRGGDSRLRQNLMSHATGLREYSEFLREDIFKEWEDKHGKETNDSRRCYEEHQ